MKYAKILKAKPIDAEITAPSSKSFTNRALIIAALADGKSILKNCLISEDIELLIEALRKIGIQITIKENNLTVYGRCGKIDPSKDPLYLGNSGTGFRFITGLVSLGHSTYTIDGSSRMHERPIGDLLNALNQAGVKTNCNIKKDYPPINITAHGLQGGRIEINASQSSQYVSSLLMIAPYANENVEICLQNDAVSQPYIQLTLQIMKDFGVKVQKNKHNHYLINTAQRYSSREYSIEADASNASYFFAAAALSQGKVRIPNLAANSIQGDIGFPHLLEEMGCSLRCVDNCLEIIGKSLHGIDITMRDMPDMVPTLAVCALFANTKTHIRDIAHLRIKETDRLDNLATELRKFGATVRTTDASLTIVPGNPTRNTITINTYNDHRMAMSFAVAGILCPNLLIENPSCVQKSFPNFWEMFSQLGLDISYL